MVTTLRYLRSLMAWGKGEEKLKEYSLCKQRNPWMLPHLLCESVLTGLWPWAGASLNRMCQWLLAFCLSVPPTRCSSWGNRTFIRQFGLPELWGLLTSCPQARRPRPPACPSAWGFNVPPTRWLRACSLGQASSLQGVRRTWWPSVGMKSKPS